MSASAIVSVFLMYMGTFIVNTVKNRRYNIGFISPVIKLLGGQLSIYDQPRLQKGGIAAATLLSPIRADIYDHLV